MGAHTLYTPPGSLRSQPSDRVDEPLDLFLGRVAGASRADEAFRGVADAGDHRGRVEIAARRENRRLGETRRYGVWEHVAVGEREGRRPGSARRRTIESHARQLRQPLPELPHQRLPFVIEPAHGTYKSLATRSTGMTLTQ